MKVPRLKQKPRFNLLDYIPPKQVSIEIASVKKLDPPFEDYNESSQNSMYHKKNISMMTVTDQKFINILSDIKPKYDISCTFFARIKKKRYNKKRVKI